ncbi:M20/M25/M40 family metallo-hydrolase [Priestia filamentosa]|uniref:M20/M25/M40 family metallo-hydrolase n=1 Tax=Priestia filamentosa TaxID=1402861 RepID=UPI0002E39B13|nr:M20/M25/M40 family metallo-hydrolase [Priestia filamentosa]
MTKQIFSLDYVNLLLELLKIDTVTPMETGKPSNILKAQKLYANFALNRLGDMCKVIQHDSPSADVLNAGCIPLTVRERARQMGGSFWDSQPNLVLLFGEERSYEQTIMFNFHMDTVDQLFPVTFDNNKFVGRGAVDMKGPGVGLLAGIESALKQKPDILDHISILVQCVSGEEGGAMGVYGTKHLVQKGYFGRFNLFVEPSGGVYFDQSSTSMTARINISGKDSTDDAPHQGHNASVLLGYLAQWLMKNLSTRIEDIKGKMCLSGLHTGYMHNKVFGTGQLLINFAYVNEESGRQIKNWVEEEVEYALINFKKEFSTLFSTLLTARDAKDICHLEWIKEGLPVLKNRNFEIEQLLNKLGLQRNPDNQLDKAFTCDAMWVVRPDIYTAVYGPGNLGVNNAHAKDEYITRQEIEEFSSFIRDLLITYITLIPNKSTKEISL